MAELIIRKASPRDIEAMARIESLSFSRPWTERMFHEDMTGHEKFCTYIVAEWKDQLVGYIGFWSIIDECQINNIAVSPFVRRKRIGTLLLDTCLQATQAKGIRRWTLEVRSGNEAAKALYKCSGFREDSVRKAYYDDPVEDALLMSLVRD